MPDPPTLPGKLVIAPDLRDQREPRAVAKRSLKNSGALTEDRPWTFGNLVNNGSPTNLSGILDRMLHDASRRDDLVPHMPGT